MADDQLFTIKIDPHSGGVRRFGWSVFDARRLLHSSIESFATMREARADAEKFVQALIAKRRTIQ